MSVPDEHTSDSSACGCAQDVQEGAASTSRHRATQSTTADASRAGGEATHVAVIGSGAWGTTFACVLADAGCQVALWTRRQALAAEINSGTNERYVPGRALPSSITASTDYEQVLRGASVVVVAVPSQQAREILTPMVPFIEDGAIIVSLMKGIEKGTGMRMSTLLADVCGVDPSTVAVVSGPNLAREIAAQQPTATVVACENQEVAERVAGLCATGYFRPYTNNDVLGVELCGAIKNVIALAVGIADGCDFGDNSKAALITRGLVEMTRLGSVLGADMETFAGLAGMGDLVATCSSPLSRNHSFGRRVGQGLSVEQAARVSQGVAEGAKSCAAIAEIATHYGVDMPITAAVVAVVEHGADVQDVIDRLLSRPRKAEGVHAPVL